MARSSVCAGREDVELHRIPFGYWFVGATTSCRLFEPPRPWRGTIRRWHHGHLGRRGADRRPWRYVVRGRSPATARRGYRPRPDRQPDRARRWRDAGWHDASAGGAGRGDHDRASVGPSGAHRRTSQDRAPGRPRRPHRGTRRPGARTDRPMAVTARTVAVVDERTSRARRARSARRIVDAQAVETSSSSMTGGAVSRRVGERSDRARGERAGPPRSIRDVDHRRRRGRGRGVDAPRRRSPRRPGIARGRRGGSPAR